MKRSLAIIAAVMLMLSIFTACSGGETKISKPAASGDTVNVTGTCSITVDGNKVTVKGTTNLITGTIGRFSVVTSDGRTLAEQEVTFTQNKESVCEFTLEGDVPSDIHGFVVATPAEDGKQSDEVYEVYGKHFENMVGEDIVWNTKDVFFSVQSETTEVAE